jgi:hypothetical protein
MSVDTVIDPLSRNRSRNVGSLGEPLTESLCCSHIVVD